MTWDRTDPNGWPHPSARATAPNARAIVHSGHGGCDPAASGRVPATRPDAVGQFAALVLTSPFTPLGKNPPDVAALFVRYTMLSTWPGERL